jgi:phytase-like protein/calcineurin-like phosphoesterase family protein
MNRLHPAPLILAVLAAALLLESPVVAGSEKGQPAPSGAGGRGVAAVVGATVETDPVPHRGDAADDPAIWVHPADPSLSTIIGTDKQGRGHVQGAPGLIPTEPNLKVAFIGDSRNGAGFRRVLELIKSEGAHMVLHQGDFDYAGNARAFFATIDSVLGRDFPYFASVGNHDVGSWREDCSVRDGCYATFLKTRMARIGVTPDDPHFDNQMYSVTYRGLKLVFVGEREAGAGDSVYAPYIQGELATDDHIWKICSWHKNQRAMQVGNKVDAMGWRVYETCKDLGAIIATAHEHSYHRTRTLTSMEDQIVDPSCSDPETICIARGSPGKSFVFVSGLGGSSVREQERCLSPTFPYGCKQEWARIYTRSQGATFGALFIIFNIDGNPATAEGYFKNVNGQIVDRFAIRVDASAAKQRAPGP